MWLKASARVLSSPPPSGGTRWERSWESATRRATSVRRERGLKATPARCPARRAKARVRAAPEAKRTRRKRERARRASGSYRARVRVPPGASMTQTRHPSFQYRPGARG